MRAGRGVPPQTHLAYGSMLSVWRGTPRRAVRPFFFLLRMVHVTDLAAAKATLLAELKEHSLILGEVTLASGAVAQYYVDARRTLMRPGGFRAAGELIAARALELGAAAVGGPATAAIPPACAA